MCQAETTVASRWKFSRLTRNIVFNLVGQGATLVLSFVAVKFIYRDLGDDALGIIYFTQATIALIGAAFSLGIGATTVREVAGHHQNEPEYVRTWVRTASAFHWLIAFTLCAVVWFLAPVLVHRWINLTTMSEDDAVRALRILGVASFLAMPQNLYRSILQGLERMDVTNALDVGITAARQFGAIAILWRGGGFFTVIWWLAGCRMLFLVAYAGGVARLFSSVGLIPGFSATAIRRNLRFAAAEGGRAIFSTVRSQGDRLIVSKLLPLGMLGTYGFASATARKGLLLASSISRAAFPSLSALHSEGVRANLMSQYRKLQDLVCWSLAPPFALVTFAAMPVFTFVFSRDVAEVMQMPVVVLCLGLYMNGTAAVPHQLALACGRPGIGTRLSLISLLLVLPLTAFLIYVWGLTGAALSLVCHSVLSYLYAIPKVCSLCCDFSKWAWYRHIAKIFGAIAVTYGAAWGALLLLGVDSIPILAAAYAISTIAYGALAFFMIGPELRATMRAHALQLVDYVRRAGRRTSDQE